jgi:NDP-sugar pyrophosphorylase family protein
LILKLLRYKRKVYAFPYDGYWLDIGRPADYARALEDVEKIRSLL